MTPAAWYAIAAASFLAAAPLVGISLVALYLFVFTGDALIDENQAAAASMGALVLIIIGSAAISEGNINKRKNCS